MISTYTTQVDAPSGIREGQAPWRVPDHVTDAVRQEAYQRSMVLDAALQDIAPQHTVRIWLLQLAMVRACHKPVEDLRQQVNSIAALLDFPTILYTKESLREVAETVDYYLDYKHLSAFLRKKQRALENEQYRCAAIAGQGQARQRAGESRPKRTPGEFKLMSELMGDLVKAATPGSGVTFEQVTEKAERVLPQGGRHG
jgi:hypothetical protein